jgi:hypothetical protein
VLGERAASQGLLEPVAERRIAPAAAPSPRRAAAAAATSISCQSRAS